MVEIVMHTSHELIIFVNYPMQHACPGLSSTVLSL